ncbi:MAG: hypothetical protein IH969_07845, partial [Candidatus Krumholzibacteriota bacterium]|nr:hypothetical protein [Candidatus Krumholzibacteriota bacterium]
MLSKEMQTALNTQINQEMYSAYLYLAMAAFFAGRSRKQIKAGAREEILLGEMPDRFPSPTPVRDTHLVAVLTADLLTACQFLRFAVDFIAERRRMQEFAHSQQHGRTSRCSHHLRIDVHVCLLGLVIHDVKVLAVAPDRYLHDLAGPG